MEKGNEIVDLNATEKKSFEKGFSKSNFMVKVIIVVVTAIVSAILIFAVKSIVFAGAYVPVAHIGNIPIYSSVAEWIGAAILLSGANFILFGKKLFVKLNGNDERSSQRYDKEYSKEYPKKKKTKIITAVMCLLLGAVAILIGSFDNIGFYDDYVKFSDDVSFSLCQVSYDDLTIYKELGYYDDEEYYTYDNAYLFSDNNGHLYDLEEVNPDGETQEYIDNIIKNYNKEVIEIESSEDLYN
jgi:hypothetical protein